MSAHAQTRLGVALALHNMAVKLSTIAHKSQGLLPVYTHILTYDPQQTHLTLCRRAHLTIYTNGSFLCTQKQGYARTFGETRVFRAQTEVDISDAQEQVEKKALIPFVATELSWSSSFRMPLQQGNKHHFEYVGGLQVCEHANHTRGHSMHWELCALGDIVDRPALLLQTPLPSKCPTSRAVRAVPC